MGSSNNLAVHCHGLAKTYGTGVAQVMALRGVDLDVGVGELFMLVGPSGCGKTTLISILSSLLDADGGLCNVLGQNMLSLTQDEKNHFRRESIGFVFQAFNLLPALTVQENVAVPLLIRGVNRRQALKRAEDMLDAVGLGGRCRSLIRQMSGGQQQRVAIARALVHEPQLVVCDEPTSSLDHESGQRVMELLSSITQRTRRTLIVVTHDNRIYGYADRIAHMDDGRVIKVETGIAKGNSQ